MKKIVVEVCKADVVNKNGRIYPRHVLEKNVNDLQELVKNRSLMGELGSPQDKFIRFSNASHLVTDLFMDGDKMMAEIEVIRSTPCGLILNKILEDSDVNFKPCGVGSVQIGENGYLIVGDDYKLVQIFAADSSPKTVTDNDKSANNSSS